MIPAFFNWESRSVFHGAIFIGDLPGYGMCAGCHFRLVRSGVLRFRRYIGWMFPGSQQVAILPERRNRCHKAMTLCKGGPLISLAKPLAIRGHIIDTAMIFPGCLTIRCLDVLIIDTLLTNIVDTLCEGQAAVVFGESFTRVRDCTTEQEPDQAGTRQVRSVSP